MSEFEAQNIHKTFRTADSELVILRGAELRVARGELPFQRGRPYRADPGAPRTRAGLASLSFSAVRLRGVSAPRRGRAGRGAAVLPTR